MRQNLRLQEHRDEIFVDSCGYHIVSFQMPKNLSHLVLKSNSRLGFDFCKIRKPSGNKITVHFLSDTTQAIR